MKKRLLLLLLVMTVFTLAACGKSSSTDPDDLVAYGDKDYLGSYTETTYKNERYKILFTVPSKDFVFATFDEILTANDMKEDGYSNKKVPEFLAEGKDYMTMYGGNGETGSSTSVVLTKTEPNVDQSAVIQTSADKIKESWEKDPSITIKECQLVKGSPVGNDQYLSYTIESNNVTFYTKQFYVFADGDMALISISATSKREIDAMFKAWTTLTETGSDTKNSETKSSETTEAATAK